MNSTLQTSNELIREQIYEVLNELTTQKEWLSLNDAATYIGVSINTFQKFRDMGLPVVEIGKVKRVSKKEIDHFLKQYMY